MKLAAWTIHCRPEGSILVITAVSLGFPILLYIGKATSIPSRSTIKQKPSYELIALKHFVILITTVAFFSSSFRQEAPLCLLL
jgi:hypothetical protein